MIKERPKISDDEIINSPDLEEKIKLSNEGEKSAAGVMRKLRGVALKILKTPGLRELAGAMAFAVAIAKAEGASGQGGNNNPKEEQGQQETVEEKPTYSIDKYFDFAEFQEGKSIFDGENFISPFEGSDILVHEGSAILDMSKTKGYGLTAEIPIEKKRHQAAILEFSLEGIKNTKYGDHNGVFVGVDNAGGDPSRATRVGTFADLFEKHTGYLQITARHVGIVDNKNDTELFSYPLTEEMKDGRLYAYTIETLQDRLPWNTIVESKIYAIRNDGKYERIGEFTITLSSSFQIQNNPVSKGIWVQTPEPGNVMFGSVFSGGNWAVSVMRVYTADRVK